MPACPAGRELANNHSPVSRLIGMARFLISKQKRDVILNFSIDGTFLGGGLKFRLFACKPFGFGFDLVHFESVIYGQSCKGRFRRKPVFF